MTMTVKVFRFGCRAPKEPALAEQILGQAGWCQDVVARAWTKAAHYQGATRITIEGKDVRVFEAICEAGARPEDCEGGAELR